VVFPNLLHQLPHRVGVARLSHCGLQLPRIDSPAREHALHSWNPECVPKQARSTREAFRGE
jgi:hypothetical protein